MTGRLRRCAAAAALAVTAVGCGPTPVPSVPTPLLIEVPPERPGPCGPVGDGLVLVVSGHANVPAPSLPEPVVRLLAAVAKDSPVDGTGPKVTVLEVTASRETVPAVNGPFATGAQNPTAIDAARQDALDSWFRAAHGVRAASGEVDVLGALSTAALYTKTGTIVLVAPALQTVDPLDFTRPPGLLGAEPDDVVALLKARDELPALSGRTLVLAGLGDTAPPQPGLSAPQRRRLTDLWRAVAEAGGACVQVVDEPRTGAPLADVPAVEVVPVPGPPLPVDGCGGVVLDQATVGFVEDEPTFRSRDDARRVVEPIAECLRADRSRAVLTTGTTACAGSADGRLALSRQRADAVGALLVELGALPAQVSTRGVGSEFPEYLPDRGYGGLLPGPAAANRSVRITPSDLAGAVPAPAGAPRRCPL